MHTKSYCQHLHHKWQCRTECGHGITTVPLQYRQRPEQQSTTYYIAMGLSNPSPENFKASQVNFSLIANPPSIFCLACMVYIRAPAMKKSKVHQFQICCARTKYLSEMCKKPDYNSLCHKASCRQFVLDLKGLSLKNQAIFGSSHF